MFIKIDVLEQDMRYGRVLRWTGLVVFFCFLLSPAAAFQVDINVEETLKPEIRLLEKNLSEEGVKSFDVEAYNRGSAPFVGRMRFEILQGNNTVFRTWSDALSLEPGSFEKEAFYFHGPDKEGSLEARAVLDYGIGQISSEKIGFENRETEYRSGFNVSRIEAYQDYIYLEFEAPSDVRSSVVSVWGESTRSYVQEKTKIRDGRGEVKIGYHPAIEEEGKVKLSLSSIEGKYYNTGSFNVELRRGIGLFFAKIGSLLGEVF